ncbi:MAG: tetratricopeptide repeat protein, partial [Xanthobacteraceae bacterium]
QHQVDHRLQGAARAQVAIRLAVIYLMNHKPDRALMTLQATQTTNLATELRRQRLLLEARALSDTGRNQLALEVIANIDTREAMRLRADILWAAKRWRESAEQIELLFGDRWRDWQPLNDTERSDLLRAAVGYALAQDKLGLDRFRERYAAKMTSTPERRAFEVATNPLKASSAEFRAVAQAIATGNTLEGFLRDLRDRYPETGAFSARATHAQQSRVPLADPASTAAIAPRRSAPLVR